MLEKAGGENKASSAGTERAVGIWGFFSLRLQHKNKVLIGISPAGGQLPAPHPSGQSKPGQTEMRHRPVLQGTHAASAAAVVIPPKFGVQVGGPQPAPAAEGGKAAGARSGRPTSTKNAAVIINNFPASEQNCIPHPFWEASLSLETVFLGTRRAFSWFPLPLHTPGLKTRSESLAHLGNNGESKESPKFHCCRYFLPLDWHKDAEKPPAQAGLLCLGGICSPHSNASQGDESRRVRAQTSHIP